MTLKRVIVSNDFPLVKQLETVQQLWCQIMIFFHLWCHLLSKYMIFKLCSPLCEMCPNTEFPAFGLNTERYFVSVRIQSECGKIRSRKNSVFGHFSRSAHVVEFNDFTQIIYKYHKNLWNICMIKNRFPLNWLWVYYTLPFRQYDPKGQVSTLHLLFCFRRELLILMTL